MQFVSLLYQTSELKFFNIKIITDEIFFNPYAINFND